MSDSEPRKEAPSATNSGVSTGENQPAQTTPGTSDQHPPATPSPVAAGTSDRGALIAKARAFLHSPQIQYQDITIKRRFLAEKGLGDAEIDALIREQPYAPAIPPRTYPQAPPSSLPTLLLGFARFFSWIGMGSAALLFIYYRFLLPRITQTTTARHSLRTHHISLMQKLTASLSSLKESQSESLASLPRMDPYEESAEFARCRTLSQVLKALGEQEPNYTTIPPVTLLRCAIVELGKGKSDEEAQPTTEEIFLLLEGKIPWLASTEAFEFKKTIYDMLLECPHFVERNTTSGVENETASVSPVKWNYVPPPLIEPSPLVRSLFTLDTALPRQKEPRPSVFQHTLETLTEFTGYISSQVYVPYRPTGGMGLSSSYGLSPAEEALKKEIRALKSLMLNRKTFMPSIPRASLFTQKSTS